MRPWLTVLLVCTWQGHAWGPLVSTGRHTPALHFCTRCGLMEALPPTAVGFFLGWLEAHWDALAPEDQQELVQFVEALPRKPPQEAWQ